MPNIDVLLEQKREQPSLLLGNEAIVRGILEAGIGIVTTYPGTPASEIGDTASAIAKQAGFYMEYSTNEIVAVEVAAGAANCGVRALTAMKHVGLNVAADAVVTLAYVGVKGGYVIVTADDPACHSSQNEQDSRYYSLLADLPCLEPSDPQEAKEMVLAAIDMSEKLELPVFLRTTTRVSHTRGPVRYGEITKPNLKGTFIQEPKRLVMVPTFARIQHEALLDKMAKASEICEQSPLNCIVKAGRSGIGIIASGVPFDYAVEAEYLLGLEASILKLGITHPLPKRRIADFLKAHKTVIVVEELEPFLETQVKAIAKDYACNVSVYGKIEKPFFSRRSELSTKAVVLGLAQILSREVPFDFSEIEGKNVSILRDLPARPPILCAGCPHRASFYVARKVGGENVIFPTDIGCYALGIAAPLKVGDILVCMGSSISTAQGIRRVTGRNTIAIVGDSTFFHASMPGLVNAVYNNAQVVLVVVDNQTTAMTGNQPHPGTGVTGMNDVSERVSIEKAAEGLGVKYVKVINPFRTREAETILKEAMNAAGPAVVVFRAPCQLMVTRERRRQSVRVKPFRISSEKCGRCTTCIDVLGCPALVIEGAKVAINEQLCVSCGLCLAVCSNRAISLGEDRQ